MKPSISSGFFNMLDSYEMVKAFQEAGYSRSEISEVHYKPFMRKEKDAIAFKKYCDDEGFAFPQGHLIFMNQGDITSRDNTYAIDNLKRNLDTFQELGVKNAVLHYSNYGTDWDPVEQWFDVRVEALLKLTDYIKDTDMVICLENLSRLWDYDAGHLLSMCKAVNNDHIGICIDTGHLNISKFGNPYDFIMQAGKYLKATHINDNMGEHHDLIGVTCDLHLMPFHGGNVKWDKVRDGLHESGYADTDGLFNYELSRHGPLEIRKIQAKYLLECYNAYFA